MKQILSIYYDEEGDFLEIDLDKHGEVIFKNLGKGIFEKVNKRTGEIVGIAIHGFTKKTKYSPFLTVPLSRKVILNTPK